MKDHTQAERDEAMRKLPKPLRDFLVSPTLRNIYLGIQKKHEFNLRELVLTVDVVTATLLGLEPESALETNIHQSMHELSNQGARELVADLHDRIFKEAQRRLRENVLEPSAWSAMEEAPVKKPTAEERAEEDEEAFIENARADDPKLQAAYQHDQEAAAAWHKQMEAEREEARKEAAKAPPPAANDADAEEEKRLGNPAQGAFMPPVVDAEGEIGKSIAAEKLAALSHSAPETVSVSIDTKDTLGGGASAAAHASAAAPQPARMPPHTYKGQDPYREPIA